MSFSMLSRTILRASSATATATATAASASSRLQAPSLLRLFSLSASLSQSQNPPSNTLFVGGLNFDTDSDGLARYIEEFSDKSVVGSRVIQDRLTGKSKGFGYVEFASEEDATEIYERIQSSSGSRGGEDELLVDGFKVRVDYATTFTPRQSRSFEDRNEGRSSIRSMLGGGSGDRASRFPPNSPSASLFLGNVPYEVSSDQITEYLATMFPDTPAVEIRVVDRGTGLDGGERDPSLPEGAKHRGFAFLQYSTTQDATTVLEGLKQRLQDRDSEPPLGSYDLRVDYRAPPKERRDSGGRGGGGGGGFGGGYSNDRRGGSRTGYGGGRGGFRGGDRTRRDFEGNSRSRYSRDGGSNRYGDDF